MILGLRVHAKNQLSIGQLIQTSLLAKMIKSATVQGQAPLHRQRPSLSRKYDAILRNINY